MHALIVEDNRINQRILVKFLQKFGFTADVASNGKEALEYLERCIWGHVPKRPDIIFVDYDMPILNGPETVNHIRTRPPFINDLKTMATPIFAFIVPGRIVSPGLWQQFIRDGYITKPLRIAGLGSALRSIKSEVIPVNMSGHGGFSGPGNIGGQTAIISRPIWGPMPLRRYPGPKSFL
ncbi:hypothetical protein FQN53_002810 [Emmonsiellopsis sp. PD_33]|nr:hypothetical protein FQN53_002810 [Emmonsiellopsis sp. PD_33]